MKPHQHSIITKEAARVVFNKVEAANTPIAVFAANGSWQVSKVSSQHFVRQTQRTPELLMAIYDVNSRLEWIEDDLAAAGIKWRTLGRGDSAVTANDQSHRGAQGSSRGSGGLTGSATNGDNDDRT